MKTDKTIIQEFDDLFGQTVFDEEWNDLDAQEKVKSFLLSKVREAREDYEKEIEKEIRGMKKDNLFQFWNNETEEGGLAEHYKDIPQPSDVYNTELTYNQALTDIQIKLSALNKEE